MLPDHAVRLQDLLTYVTLRGMALPSSEPALTLVAAADRLGVTPQRISQMLKKGELQGPPAGEGRRAAKNAERVWTRSVEEALTRPRRHRRKSVAMVEEPIEARVAALEASLLGSRTESGSGAEVQRLANRERAARDAALQLKVAADAALAALKVERERNEELEAENARLTALVERAQRRAAVAEAASQAYGEGLTQLLAPSDASDF